MITNFCSFVAQPNTPETDAQPSVMHVVRAKRDGTPVQLTLMATDPMDAIEQARKQPDILWEETDD